MLNLQLIARHLSQNGMNDPVRNKPRVEIPASVALTTNDKTLLKKNLAIILENQQPDGYWLEYSYEKEEEAVGYYGAIPTAFCILALARGFEKTEDDQYLHAAIKASDYLYRHEKSGYFYKAGNNKSDVINTNLMCGLALLQTSKLMANSSRRKENYRVACARSIRRSINSQHWNGAFPYTSGGLTVPLLYHSMTLSLLIFLASEFKDSHLQYSILKAVDYLKTYTRKDGSVDWQKEKFADKTGAIWIYAWNASLMKSLSLKEEQASLAQLAKKKGIFFFTDDYTKQQDPFYSAWCLIALSITAKVLAKPTNQGALRFVFAKMVNLFPQALLVLKIIQRKIFSFGLDKGPVEYW